MEPTRALFPGTEPAGPPTGIFNPEAGVPKSFGKFRIIDLLHKSLMSVVYKAEQDNPSRTVALKIPLSSSHKFVAETQLTAKVFGAGVVPVLEAGVAEGVPFYTMPFIEGRSLAEHVSAVKADTGARLDLFVKICSVVQRLHEGGHVHLDLKPRNIMIDRAGEVWLLDFGISRAIQAAEGKVEVWGVAGTPPYMAPEQTHHETEKTPAADVYALGVILYELLTDSTPFHFGANDPENIFRVIRQAQARRPSALKRDLSDRYDSLVISCLCKDPKGRPAMAGELAKLLTEIRAGGHPLLPELPRSKKPMWLAVSAGVLMLGGGIALYLVHAPLSDWERITKDSSLADVTNVLGAVPTGFKLKLSSPSVNRTFYAGQPFRVRVESDQECFMAIFLHSRDGKTYLLSPATANPLMMRLLDLETTSTVGEPFGLEVVQVIAYSHAADYQNLVSLIGGGIPHDTFARILADNSASRGIVQGADSSRQRSSAYMTIETRKAP